MNTRPYRLKLPAARDTSVVFASPHSGRDYPESFLAQSVLDEKTIRSSEDAFVDDLFSQVAQFGAPLIAATAPRAYLDLNRGVDELDPALIEDVRKSLHNPRITSGLGVIPRVVASGRAIYRGKIQRSVADERIASFWHPYHRTLGKLLDESHALFGEAILIDCHSMPHEAVTPMGKAGRSKPDVVIGDRFGASASSVVIEGIVDAFKSEGLSVTRNSPFAGAYIVQQYGNPSHCRHAIQVEIDRSLYMDERKIEPRSDFAEFQALVTRVAAKIADIGRAELPLAAE